MKRQEKDYIYQFGTFITAYARYKTISTSQKIKNYSIEKYGKDMYIYSDTDSISTTLSIEECKKFCDIDDYKLYFWKHENNFSSARFVRQKTYVKNILTEIKLCKLKKNYKMKKRNKKLKKSLHYKFHTINNKLYKDKLNITCAGMPKRCYNNVTFDNFKVGFKCDNKLQFTHVKGRCNS